MVCQLIGLFAELIVWVMTDVIASNLRVESVASGKIEFDLFEKNTRAKERTA
jgi:hypothetical protein